MMGYELYLRCRYGQPESQISGQPGNRAAVGMAEPNANERRLAKATLLRTHLFKPLWETRNGYLLCKET